MQNTKNLQLCRIIMQILPQHELAHFAHNNNCYSKEN